MEFAGLFLSGYNLLLHLNLLVEVLLLEFLELANLDQLSLVSSQRFRHRQLVLVAAGVICIDNLAVSLSKLLTSRWQRRRAVLEEEVRALGRCSLHRGLAGVFTGSVLNRMLLDWVTLSLHLHLLIHDLPLE